MFHRGSNPDVYVTWRDEFRASQGLQTSQNHEPVLDVCSVPATDMRQNQPQVDGRATPPTHLTRGHQGNIGHAPGPCQRTSSPPCIRVLRNRAPAAGWESRGLSDTHSHRSVQFRVSRLPIHRSKDQTPTFPMVPLIDSPTQPPRAHSPRHARPTP